jgi:hypothetical protein
VRNTHRLHHHIGHTLVDGVQAHSLGMGGNHMTKTQLERLAEPFPKHLVKAAPKGKYGEYVSHSAVTERLLAVVGPFSTRITEVIEENDGTISGCVLELTVEIDGRWVTVQEAGDAQGNGRKNKGALLKDASSDAIKRCAMRLGLGLHLWSQDDYFLDQFLADKDTDDDQH